MFISSRSTDTLITFSGFFCYVIFFFFEKNLVWFSDAVLEVRFRMEEESCKRGGAGVGPRLVFFFVSAILDSLGLVVLDYSLGTLETAHLPISLLRIQN
jgi:hypothetical protein